jgi:hypothetical protein
MYSEDKKNHIARSSIHILVRNDMSVNVVCYYLMVFNVTFNNISVISWRVGVNEYERTLITLSHNRETAYSYNSTRVDSIDDHDIRFCIRPTCLASLLKQQPEGEGRHAVTLGHIIMIQNQPVYVLTP